MAVETVFGATTAWVADIDPGPRKILAHRFPHAPNLGDVTRVDWSSVEPVDIIAGGFPCQPVSTAGRRLGAEDERWLWDEVIRAVRVLRPGLVVLENVRGLLTAGRGRLFGRVLGSLADAGYDAQWHGLRAADIGACHGRWRVFVIAHPHDAGLEGRRVRGRGAGELTVGPRGLAPGKLLPTPVCGCQAWGPYAAAVHRHELMLGRPAPAPTEVGPRGNARLSARATEWMMGLPDGWVTGVPGVTRNEALKALGNGVVPLQAAAALRHMIAREAAVA